ncbi:Esterase/lipase [Hahella chejuensis KCTC 2396]|uniref:Esterase/lipase n=1 Tax=Hahella chejuensis (strain KCTC 2396) TaxID=349521 RepID=Q2SLQ4_HAHCH|nr:alpha/beta hydrolase [Hahella chejuensis]ABC28420.1 Esterase/lipase [Hahella chejuensis KCTC 2396]
MRLQAFIAFLMVSVSVAAAESSPETTSSSEQPSARGKSAPTPDSGFIPPAEQGVISHQDMAYVSNGHAQQKLDLYLPSAGKNIPLIIWIHGGGWMNGDKVKGVPIDYVDEGYAVASLNYRLSNVAKFPAQLEDVKAAVRWLRANAKQYDIDPDRIGAWGASAGGHLAALLGTTGDVEDFDVGENLNVSSRVQAVVDYFGPTDFLQMDEHRLPASESHDKADSPESRLIGGAIQDNKDKVKRTNPITYVSEGDAPFLIVHGDADPIVPHHQSQLLETALKEAEVPVSFYTVKGGQHGRFNDLKVVELTKAFFTKHLKPVGYWALN